MKRYQNLFILMWVANLMACSSTVTKQESTEFWYCGATANKEWLCVEDENTFNRQVEKKVVQNEFTEEQIAQQNILKEEPVINQEPIFNEEPVDVLISEQPVADTNVENTSINKKEETVKNQESTVANNDSESIKGQWIIQLAAYSKKASAEKLFLQIENSKIVSTLVNNQQYFNVIVDDFFDKTQAQQVAYELQQKFAIKPWIRSSHSLEQVLQK